MDRCCDDALALLRTHPIAEKGLLRDVGIALARRRIGWALLASFARSRLLRQEHAKKLTPFLWRELAQDVDPAGLKDVYNSVLHCSARAAVRPDTMRDKMRLIVLLSPAMDDHLS